MAFIDKDKRIYKTLEVKVRAMPVHFISNTSNKGVCKFVAEGTGKDHNVYSCMCFGDLADKVKKKITELDIKLIVTGYINKDATFDNDFICNDIVFPSEPQKAGNNYLVNVYGSMSEAKKAKTGYYAKLYEKGFVEVEVIVDGVPQRKIAHQDDCIELADRWQEKAEFIMDKLGGWEWERILRAWIATQPKGKVFYGVSLDVDTAKAYKEFREKTLQGILGSIVEVKESPLSKGGISTEANNTLKPHLGAGIGLKNDSDKNQEGDLAVETETETITL
jgi:hypothetical protein